MKKLWGNYSYAIILVVLSFLTVLMISIVLPLSTDDYMRITVAEGETLWQISEQYSNSHHLSQQEFIKWVEHNNGISGDYIIAGEELIIPVENKSVDIEEINNLASN